MVQNPPANAGDTGSLSGSGRPPRGGKGNPTPVLLSGKLHGQRSLAGRVHGVAETDTTERLTWHSTSNAREQGPLRNFCGWWDKI